jgi:hypothetical protein
MEQNNTKPFWKYVKSRKQDNIGVAPLKERGHLINNSKEKAQIINKQFSSVFTREKVNKMPNPHRIVQQNIPNIKITQYGVAKLMWTINPSKASSPDNIPNRVLKQCADHLAPALTIIFQRLIDHGKLPNDWLNANVSCIFKKGDKHAAENYRPVSLTSVPCKLLEHIICGHMMKHLENHNV